MLMRSMWILLTVVAMVFPLLSCKQTPRGDARREVPRYTIDQFYKSKRISGGIFSDDGTRLLISSNESGIFNLYEINVADGSEHQLTHSTVDSYFAVGYVPGTKQVLYTADRGGNENSHLFLLRPDGKAKDLTPDPREKATFLGWSRDKKAFYFLSNKRTPKMFDLYRTDVRTWKTAQLYTNDQGYDVSAISWDEKTIALTQNITTSEQRLFLYSLSSHRMTEISDPKTAGVYEASGFSRDDGSFFYLTDAGREFQYLVQYHLRTGERSTLFQTDWDVMYSYASERERYRVIAVNADGRNVLKVLDGKSGQEVTLPAIPDGDITSVSISPDEKLMRLSVGSSRAPVDMYVYNFESRELTKLLSTLNPEIDPKNLVTAEVVRFASFDSLEIPAIFYKPLTASPSERVPAIVWVHGGPGGQTRVGYSAFIQYLVNHGYAILAVNNRGSSGYGKTFYKLDDRDHGDRDLTDCIFGKRYLQTQDCIDSAKIGILGGSYGGFMTMAAMTFHPEEFRVGVDLFGVTNWLRTLRSIPPYWESVRKALYAEMGDPFTADSVPLAAISPLFHANQIKRPVMVLQGANDVRVLKPESDEIVAAMRKNKVPVEYVVFPDEGHGFLKKENEIKGYGGVLAFLDTYLKGGTAK